MLSRFRPRLSFANVVSVVALMAALGGGAYAATSLPPNSVGTPQLKDGAVTNRKVKNGTLTGAKIQASTLGTVPNATHAHNSSQLGGSGPAAFFRSSKVQSFSWTSDADCSASPGPACQQDVVTAAGFNLRAICSEASGGKPEIRFDVTAASGSTNAAGVNQANVAQGQGFAGPGTALSATAATQNGSNGVTGTIVLTNGSAVTTVDATGFAQEGNDPSFATCSASGKALVP